MRRDVSRAVLFVLIALIPAQASAQTIADAVVRIKSHGASGTVIWSSRGRSIILGCAHMFEDPGSLQKRLRIDGPPQPGAPKVIAQAQVIAVDRAGDLSLLELKNGPFYAVPVAPPGLIYSRSVWSLGYDEMKWPITARTARVLGADRSTIYTDKIPWHGRSGGALVDSQSRKLIGVVQGYEVGGQRRGLYVSHDRVVSFLSRHAPWLLGQKQATPRQSFPQLYADPFQLRQPRPSSPCPPSG